MEDKDCRIEMRISVDAKGNFAAVTIRKTIANTIRRLRKMGIVRYTVIVETKEETEKLKSRL